MPLAALNTTDLRHFGSIKAGCFAHKHQGPHDLAHVPMGPHWLRMLPWVVSSSVGKGWNCMENHPKNNASALEHLGQTYGNLLKLPEVGAHIFTLEGLKSLMLPWWLTCSAGKRLLLCTGFEGCGLDMGFAAEYDPPFLEIWKALASSFGKLTPAAKIEGQ